MITIGQYNYVLKQSNRIEFYARITPDQLTFQDQPAVFNDLPLNIRMIKNNNASIKKSKSFYKDKGLARSLSL